MSEKLFSVVVPVYNSSKSIDELYAELVGFFLKNNLNHEIIFVDDRSEDNSWEKIKKNAAENSNVKGIRLKKNYGQLAATTCGIRNAKGDYIITIDDDLQFHPNEIKKLIDAISGTEKIILGNPDEKKHIGFRKMISFFVAHFCLYVIIPSYRQKNLFTSFRLIHKSKFPDDFHLFYLWKIKPEEIKCVAVEHTRRMHKKRNYSFLKVIGTHSGVLFFIFQKISGYGSVAALISFYFYSSGKIIPVIFITLSVLFFLFKLLVHFKRKLNYEIAERT